MPSPLNTERPVPNSAVSGAPLAGIRGLYLCYFGLREPLVQTQVMPYLRALVEAGAEMDLLTFEPDAPPNWPADEARDRRDLLAADGIRWKWRRYHKCPALPATLLDVLGGAGEAIRFARHSPGAILHARAHIPLAMALLSRPFCRARILFDVRGLMADEYADAGVWDERSLPYRLIKRLEKIGFRSADHLVVLTHRMRCWLEQQKRVDGSRVEVIPCCVNTRRFTPGTTQGPFQVVYAGSTTGLYLLAEMARLFSEIRKLRPDATWTVLTRTPAEHLWPLLKAEGLDPTHCEVSSVSAEDVPTHLGNADLGFSFRKPSFSQVAASPTKIAEYLACGVPVVSNSGIGDVDDLLRRTGVGVLVDSFSPEALSACAREALALASAHDVRTRCREVALREFDLGTLGGPRYVSVYRRLGASEPPLA